MCRQVTLHKSRRSTLSPELIMFGCWKGKDRKLNLKDIGIPKRKSHTYVYEGWFKGPWKEFYTKQPFEGSGKHFPQASASFSQDIFFSFASFWCDRLRHRAGQPRNRAGQPSSWSNNKPFKAEDGWRDSQARSRAGQPKSRAGQPRKRAGQFSAQVPRKLFIGIPQDEPPDGSQILFRYQPPATPAAPRTHRPHTDMPNARFRKCFARLIFFLRKLAVSGWKEYNSTLIYISEWGGNLPNGLFHPWAWEWGWVGTNSSSSSSSSSSRSPGPGLAPFTLTHNPPGACDPPVR